MGGRRNSGKGFRSTEEIKYQDAVECMEELITALFKAHEEARHPKITPDEVEINPSLVRNAPRINMGFASDPAMMITFSSNDLNQNKILLQVAHYIAESINLTLDHEGGVKPVGRPTAAMEHNILYINMADVRSALRKNPNMAETLVTIPSLAYAPDATDTPAVDNNKQVFVGRATSETSVVPADAQTEQFSPIIDNKLRTAVIAEANLNAGTLGGVEGKSEQGGRHRAVTKSDPTLKR